MREPRVCLSNVPIVEIFWRFMTSIVFTVCDRSSTVGTRSPISISVIGFILSLGKNFLKIWLLSFLCSISHSSAFIFHPANDSRCRDPITQYRHIIKDEQIHVLSVQLHCRATNRFEIIACAESLDVSAVRLSC